MANEKRLTAKQRTVPMWEPVLMAEQDDRAAVDESAIVDGPELREVANERPGAGWYWHFTTGGNMTICGQRITSGPRDTGLKRCQACRAEASRLRARIVR